MNKWFLHINFFQVKNGVSKSVALLAATLNIVFLLIQVLFLFLSPFPNLYTLNPFIFKWFFFIQSEIPQERHV